MCCALSLRAVPWYPFRVLSRREASQSSGHPVLLCGIYDRNYRPLLHVLCPVLLRTSVGPPLRSSVILLQGHLGPPVSQARVEEWVGRERGYRPIRCHVSVCRGQGREWRGGREQGDVLHELCHEYGKIPT